ncbi:MAG: crotonase/enoyl-CoA hydratase family protein [Acidimicrobiales bacterium]
MAVVDTELTNRVLISRINSGKGNPLSPTVLKQLNADLDRCEADDEVGSWVVMGQPGLFSGGFDLSIMLKGTMREITELVYSGGDLFTRMYASKTPIVVGATGHAIAGGALMLLAADSRIGYDGPLKIGLNEVAIGMVLPSWALTLAGARLSPRHIQQSTATARIYDADGARDAGFLDLLVAPGEHEAATLAEAERLAALDAKSYATTIGVTRGETLAQLRADLATDRALIDTL